MHAHRLTVIDMNQIYTDHNSSLWNRQRQASILINEYKSTKYRDNNIDHALKMKYNSINYYKSTEIQIIASNIYIYLMLLFVYISGLIFQKVATEIEVFC